MCRGRQVRDGGAYGCAVPRAYANLNPGLRQAMLVKQSNSSRKHRILSLQICVCQTVRLTRKPGRLQNLVTDAGMCVHCTRHMTATPATWCSASMTHRQASQNVEAVGQWRKMLCGCVKAKGPSLWTSTKLKPALFRATFQHVFLDRLLSTEENTLFRVL